MKGAFSMDYELMMNGNVKIGQMAPEFEGISTQGPIPGCRTENWFCLQNAGEKIYL